MNEKKSMIVLAILVIGSIFAFVPAIAPVSATITDRPEVWYAADGDPGGVGWEDPIAARAATNVSVYTGNMTISGAQIWLWWSLDGSALIVDGDYSYAGPFLLSDITATITDPDDYHGYNYENDYGEFAFDVANDWVNGTIPLETPGGLHWIKVTDVNPNVGGDNIPSSDIAVSVNRINVWPTIVVTPEEGPAGYNVMIEGRAFSANSLVNVSVGIGTWSLSGPAYGFASIGYTSRNITAGDLGEFTKYFDEIGLAKGAPDYHKESNVNGDDALQEQLITCNGYDYESENEASDTYNLLGRQFEYIITYTSAGGRFDSDGPDDFGSAPNGVNPAYVSAEVFGVVEINGTNFNVYDGLKFIWDYDTDDPIELDPVYTKPFDQEEGCFNASVSVPITTAEEHLVGVVDETWSWNFTVLVVRTLIVEPHQVYIGDTVTVDGYGFDDGEQMALWFWSYNDFLSDDSLNFAGTPEYGFKFGTTYFSDYYWMNLTAVNNANVTTDSRGFFTFSFIVPHDHGGDHAVVAYENSTYNPAAEDTLDDWGIGGVTIKPKIILVNGSDQMGYCEVPDYDDVFVPKLDDYDDMYSGTFVFDPANFLEDGATIRVGTLVYIWVQGLPVIGGDSDDGWVFKGAGEAYGSESNSFSLTLDNDLMVGGTTWRPATKANATGDTITAFIIVGQPGLHVIQLYQRPGWPSWGYDSYIRGNAQLPLDWTFFNIAGPTADTQMILDAQDELSEDLNAKMDELMATVSAELSALASDMADMMDDMKQAIAGVVNDGVSQILSSIDGVKSDVATVKSDVSSVKSDVSSLSSDLDDVSTDISASSDTLAGVAGELTNSITYMYVLLALVVITLVLELVILLRKRA
jgi:hypothetical protein